MPFTQLFKIIEVGARPLLQPPLLNLLHHLHRHLRWLRVTVQPVRHVHAWWHSMYRDLKGVSEDRCIKHQVSVLNNEGPNEKWFCCVLFHCFSFCTVFIIEVLRRNFGRGTANVFEALLTWGWMYLKLLECSCMLHDIHEISWICNHTKSMFMLIPKIKLRIIFVSSTVIQRCLPSHGLQKPSTQVYYAQLGKESRMEGIASAVAEMMPDIAVITEQWSEQGQILEKIRQKTSRAFLEVKFSAVGVWIADRKIGYDSVFQSSFCSPSGLVGVQLPGQLMAVVVFLW